MSRRKKLPGFNPKQKARDSITRNMRDINNVEEIFRGESLILSDRMDTEGKALELIESPELRDYLTTHFNRTKNGFVGLMAEFTQKLIAIRTPADALACEWMDILAEQKWDDVRDKFSLADVTLTAASTDAIFLGQECTAAAIELFSQYASRTSAMHRAMRMGLTIPEVIQFMEAVDDHNAPAKEAAAPEAEEETANV
ncbi:hypothetical protein BIZ78_gp232 [Erwinia phage vB_EamM_Caitlin]|uniref:hypothetical protein n=1 Tax=Erwinia phage vB_EamM_Caitlin TaxID=1883379 RepID=UPI00081C64BB|nr:hypothetical protein BIZ78_gp232 [Erwinia phage vB_EamM_Caitlin]ANZ48343.1 hypothetical protein CAITLIN_48 [Erwinia phage vB_EamM_Caitlin]